MTSDHHADRAQHAAQQPHVEDRDDSLLTYTDVARVFNVRKNTLFTWVACRAIPHLRLGPRSVRFRRSEIEQWLSHRAVGLVSSPNNRGAGRQA